MNLKNNKIIDYFEEQFFLWINSQYKGSEQLQKACKYALQGKGKRIRPQLVLLCNQVCKGKMETAINPAIAIEVVHTYSLVHDDLPIFDDDNLRRGRPTVHKVFDQATAVLVGDALLSDAWSLLAKTAHAQTHLENRLKMIDYLSQNIGSRGMVQGQMLDLIYTNKKSYNREILDHIHILKTGKLLATACACGALSANAPKQTVDHLFQIGEHIGLAFQIIDDLLDKQEGTGKTSGKDAKQEKLTYLKCMGEDQARETAYRLSEKAKQLLNLIEGETTDLSNLVENLLNRLF